METKIMSFEEKYPLMAEMERNGNADSFALNAISEWRKLHVMHPFLPKMVPVEVLNLIMRREFAEQIVRGEKNIEWRNYSMQYHKRLIDANMQDYLTKHADDKLLHKLVPVAIRTVKSIHFHNYNNTWTLDCEVTDNNVLTMDKVGIKIMHDYYNNYECDEEYEMLRKMGQRSYPTYFFFVLGKIINRRNI